MAFIFLFEFLGPFLFWAFIFLCEFLGPWIVIFLLECLGPFGFEFLSLAMVSRGMRRHDRSDHRAGHAERKRRNT